MKDLSTRGYANLIGNKAERIYHHIKYCDGSCQVNEIPESNRLYFTTVLWAKLAGFRVCEHCLDNIKKKYAFLVANYLLRLRELRTNS